MFLLLMLMLGERDFSPRLLLPTSSPPTAAARPPACLSACPRPSDALKKFKFVCSLCVKVRLKVEKRKGKAAKGKARKGASSPSPTPPPPSSASTGKPSPGANGFSGDVEVVKGKPKKKTVKPKAASPTPSAAAGMPPPSSKPKLKRRRSSDSSSAGGNGTDKKAGEGSGKPRKPKLKRQRSAAAAEQPARKSAMDVSDEDDSWGEESVDEDGRGEKGARASAYSTRDRKGRVKYVEEASDNEGEWERGTGENVRVRLDEGRDRGWGVGGGYIIGWAKHTMVFDSS